MPIDIIFICSSNSVLITVMNLVSSRQSGFFILNTGQSLHYGDKASQASVRFYFSWVCLLSDDGKLSLEEFQSYFTDGILTDEQMQELYYSIDRQRTE